MLTILRARARQGHRTSGFPAQEPLLSDRFRGRPTFDASRCPDGCRQCAEACPTDAIVQSGTDGKLALDLGRCLFCDECTKACPEGVMQFTKDYRLATSTREALLLDGKDMELAHAVSDRIRRIYGRSLRLRQVSAGGCNGCEADVNVLSTIVFDLSRFGISIVASPRHADGLLITGPVSNNMEAALRLAYEAVPPPRLVIAVGACAIAGGPFMGHPQVRDGAGAVVPVDLFVPGCPPHPVTILDGLLRLLGQRGDQRSK